jgi:site-specific recombinase XerD
MFEKLFKRSSAVERHRSAPLLEERLRFLEHLAAQQFCRHSLRQTSQYLLVIGDYLNLPMRKGESINATEIEEAALRWSKLREPRNRKSRQRFVGCATRWLQLLQRWEPAPVKYPFGEEIAAYSNSMRDERGLSAATISSRCWIVADFLCRVDGALADLTVRQVDALLAEKVTKAGYLRVTVQSYASVLRDFFRFAEREGWCRAGIAEAIRGPRVFPQESLPQGPSWKHVRKLIVDCEGDKPVDVRNRAILLLLSVYGLRAGEVVRLRCQDFDWKLDRLTVHRSKSHCNHQYPLCASVGTAVSRYLRDTRPKSDLREVFLTMRPPFRPLSTYALTALVTRKLKALNIPLSHYGPHALRHACATHLLAEGLTLKEIGDHLGHRLPETTAIYTKVDLRGLREVADFDLGGLV